MALHKIHYQINATFISELEADTYEDAVKLFKSLDLNALVLDSLSDNPLENDEITIKGDGGSVSQKDV